MKLYVVFVLGILTGSIQLFALQSEDIGNAKDSKEYKKMVEYVEKYATKKKDIVRTLEKDGYIIDCVYIDKQVGMERKGMEKHVLTRKPSFEIQKYNTSKFAQKSVDISDLAFRVDCPIDTIPVKRLTISDITKFKTLKHYYSKNNSSDNKYALPQVYGNGHEYAMVFRNILN